MSESQIIEKQFIWSVFARDNENYYYAAFKEFVPDENRDPEFNVKIGFRYMGAHDDHTPKINKVQVDVQFNQLDGLSDLELIEQTIAELNATLHAVTQERVDGDDVHANTIDGFVEGFCYEPS